MIELRCPACGSTNALARETPLDRARCAACGGGLAHEETVRYEVETGALAGRRLTRSELRAAAARGEITKDTRIAEEGRPPFAAGERADLFPSVAPPASTAAPVAQPRTTRWASERPRPPEGVYAVVWLNWLLAGGLVVLGLVAFGTLGELGLGVIGLLPIVLAMAPIGLAAGLKGASSAARSTQIVFSVLGALVAVFGLVESHGDGAVFWVVGLAYALAPIFLLSSSEAGAFFKRSP